MPAGVAATRDELNGECMSELVDLIQQHLKAYGVSESAFSRRIGASSKTVWTWRKRGIKALPDQKHLEGVARETRTAYDTVLQAALRDTNYLARPDNVSTLPTRSQPVDVDVPLAARTELSFASERSQAATDKIGEESQDPGSDEPL